MVGASAVEVFWMLCNRSVYLLGPRPNSISVGPTPFGHSLTIANSLRSEPTKLVVERTIILYSFGFIHYYSVYSH